MQERIVLRRVPPTLFRPIGYSGPWAVEVFSEELAGLPLDALNAQAFNTTSAQFAE